MHKDLQYAGMYKQCDLCFLSHSEEFAKTQFQSHNLENIQIIVTELEIYI